MKLGDFKIRKLVTWVRKDKHFYVRVDRPLYHIPADILWYLDYFGLAIHSDRKTNITVVSMRIVEGRVLHRFTKKLQYKRWEVVV